MSMSRFVMVISLISTVTAVWVSPAESSAEDLADSLEFVCLLQSSERPRSDHRHVHLPAFVSCAFQRLLDSTHCIIMLNSGLFWPSLLFYSEYSFKVFGPFWPSAIIFILHINCTLHSILLRN